MTATSFDVYTGEAMAMGERTPLAVLDAPASGRMAVAEALTNIVAARIGQMGDVKLSANWMAAAGHPGEDARLFDTCLLYTSCEFHSSCWPKIHFWRGWPSRLRVWPPRRLPSRPSGS